MVKLILFQNISFILYKITILIYRLLLHLQYFSNKKCGHIFPVCVYDNQLKVIGLDNEIRSLKQTVIFY